MAVYATFLPGQLGPLDPTKITGAGAITQVAGLYITGITAASAAAAAAAVQAAIPGVGNQQGLMQTALVSNTTTA